MWHINNRKKKFMSCIKELSLNSILVGLLVGRPMVERWGAIKKYSPSNTYSTSSRPWGKSLGTIIS